MEDDVPVNANPLPAFRVIVTFLEELQNLSGPGSVDRRKALIDGFIRNWREKVGNDIYPAFQLILPHVDGDFRQLYNVKEKSLGKILVSAMNLAPKSSEAISLMNFKQGHGSAQGNFANLAYSIIDQRDSKLGFSTTKVDRVIEMLQELPKARFAEQVQILRQMLQTMNAMEMKWVLRIILRNLHIHVSEKTFLKCWHQDALMLFNVTNNLRMVCHQLWDSSIRLEEKDQVIRPLYCFKPQRALFRRKVLDQFPAVAEKMPGWFYIEEKMDGERMQIHMTDYGKTMRYFSRRGKEYTDYYGKSVEDVKGSLSRFLPQFLNPKVESCVLDGEIVAWDAVNKEVCPLGKIKQAAVSDGEGQWRPMFLAFDIVHLNGKDLAPYALEDRKKALERVIPVEKREAGKGYIEILPYIIGKNPQDISTEFQRVIVQMSEGLVVKNPKSVYKVDALNDSWLKIKPEFMSGYQGENFDLLVVGGLYGSGSRAKLLASYLCAVRSDSGDEYFSLCRVGSGFCMAIYEKIAHLTENRWYKPADGNPPPWLKLGGQTADVYIDPEHSIVIEVKASQIVPTDRYYVGSTLRFPRFVALRKDKSSNECLTFAEFMDYKNQELAPDQKKRAVASQAAAPRKKRLKLPEVTTHEAKSDLFSDITFFIPGDIYDPRYCSQEDLEKLVQEYGGKVTRSGTVDAIKVADCAVPRIATIIEGRKDDVVHPRWIFDSIDNNIRLPMEPDHYLFARDQSLEMAQGYVDQFGFPLHRKPAVADVERLLAKMNVGVRFVREDTDKTLDLLNDAALYTDKSINVNNPGLLFQGMVVYIHESVKDAATVSRLLKFGSARIASIPNDTGLTHVVCNDKSNYKQYLERLVAKTGPQQVPQMVSSDWVKECWSEGTRLDESHALL